MLRFLALILSVYFLVLTAVPCCAFDGCETVARQQMEHPNKKQQQQDEGCKQCSPFFACHDCAGGFIVIEKFQVASLGLPNYLTPYERPIHALKGCFTSSYWQPPRA